MKVRQVWLEADRAHKKKHSLQIGGLPHTALPRKTGDASYTAEFKRAAIRAHVDGEPSGAMVAQSTMNTWMRSETAIASRPHSAEVYERVLSDGVAPVVRWIEAHLVTQDDQKTMSPARVMEYVKENHQELLTEKRYPAKRRMVERLLKTAWQRVFGYEPISQCVGLSPAVQTSGMRCSCRHGCGDKCTNRMRMVECSRSNCSFRGACSNRLWANGLSAPVMLWIGDTTGKGRGVFAEENLKRGILVREYVGDIVDRATMETRSIRGRNRYVMELSQDKFIDASIRGNHSRMINHDCAPNCQAQLWTVGIHRRIGIVTAKQIRLGEEITIDYGESYALDPCMCSTFCVCGVNSKCNLRVWLVIFDVSMSQFEYFPPLVALDMIEPIPYD
jgi:hypothetical protein